MKKEEIFLELLRVTVRREKDFAENSPEFYEGCIRRLNAIYSTRLDIVEHLAKLLR